MASKLIFACAHRVATRPLNTESSHIKSIQDAICPYFTKANTYLNKQISILHCYNTNSNYHGRRKQNKCGWVVPQKKKILEYMPFSVVWCLLINGIGRLISRCYLHYLWPLTSQHYKRRLFEHNSSGW